MIGQPAPAFTAQAVLPDGAPVAALDNARPAAGAPASPADASTPPTGAFVLSAGVAAERAAAAAVCAALRRCPPMPYGRAPAAGFESELAPLLGPGGCVDVRVATPPQPRPSWIAAAAAALRPFYADNERAARERAEIMDIHLRLLVDMRAHLAFLLSLVQQGQPVHPEAVADARSVVARVEQDLEMDMRGYEWQAWLRQQPALARPEPKPVAALERTSPDAGAPALHAGAPTPPTGASVLPAGNVVECGAAAAVCAALRGYLPSPDSYAPAAGPESELGPGGCVGECVATPPQQRPRPSWTAAAATALRPYFVDDERAARERAEVIDIHVWLLADMREHLAFLLSLVEAGRPVHPEAVANARSLVAEAEQDFDTDMRGFEWQAWLRQQPALARAPATPRTAKAKDV